jgi:hypothetical protein
MSISNLIFYDGSCLELPVWSTCHLRLKLQKFPSPRWEFLLTCPNRLSTFNWDQSLVLPGTSKCHHACKLPIVLMGKLLTCLPRLSLAQLRLTLRSTTGCTSRRDLNFSHRPDGKKVLTCLPRLTLAQLRTLRSTTGGT